MYEKLLKLDLKHIWHPCTQMKDHEKLPLIIAKKAKGMYIYDYNNKSYIDCISSWWVNLFGHCDDRISIAIQNQLKELEHVLLAGVSHKPIIDLATRLCDLLPNPLNKCFFADNGSSAIEIALKMSFHYHLNKGHKKHKFLALSNSYHGETLGALSIGNLGLYKKTYKPLLLNTLITPVSTSDDFSKELKILENILKKEAKNICAFILEPLIQCAGNMHFYSKNFIKEACKVCKKYNIDIIFDEIAVGFGRSGEMFALQECEVVPDYLCLSKGITGGFLPLSVVVTNDEVYDAFYDDYKSNKAFLHSHSYTGNALACAAANAVLDIFEQDQIIKNNKTKAKFIKEEWFKLANNTKLGNFRAKGMVFAFDILKSKHDRIAMWLCNEALKRGLLIRPLANTVYLMPPYIINYDQVKFIVNTLDDILKDL